ncbi:hypothetical protein TNCT_427971 [Trichonephila clavata]|uniref:Uncharacterized protein n=1 Tax=Trichonephila clavata TaxID=2740835 RepID=A0A8X6GNY4_TRICU|nr:hypothetical protein TNCT_427971 [Trichonephila clavata]
MEIAMWSRCGCCPNGEQVAETLKRKPQWLKSGGSFFTRIISRIMEKESILSTNSKDRNRNDMIIVEAEGLLLHKKALCMIYQYFYIAIRQGLGERNSTVSSLANGIGKNLSAIPDVFFVIAQNVGRYSVMHYNIE